MYQNVDNLCKDFMRVTRAWITFQATLFKFITTDYDSDRCMLQPRIHIKSLEAKNLDVKKLINTLESPPK